jgi:ABC-type lipoprotein release transport system permease subunit
MKNYQLAWRNLWRNRRRTLITAASVFFAVFFALLFRSLQIGSYDYMYQSAIETYSGYLQLQQINWWDDRTIDHSFSLPPETERKLLNDNNVISIIPRVESFALASGETITKGVMVIGIHPEKEQLLSDIRGKKVRYRLNKEALDKMSNDPLFNDKIRKNATLFSEVSFANDNRLLQDLGIDPKEAGKYIPAITKYAGYKSGDINTGQSGVWIGAGLAKFLSLETGDTLVLIGQGYRGASAAGKYEIKGLVKLPVPDLNNSIVYMPYDIAQELYKMGENLTSLVIHIRENDDKSIESTKERLSNHLPEGARLVDWKEMNEVMIQQMEADNISGIFMITILYMVIAFGIFGTILMMTAERRREMGVLVAIGMQKKKLASVITYEMLYIGLLGIILSAVVCIPVITYGYYHPIIFKGELAYMMEDYGFEPKLVFEPVNTYFLWQALIVSLMVLVSLIYPAGKIFKMNVVTALKA